VNVVTFYGLRSCDTCRKASKALKDHDVTVIDVRTDGVAEDVLTEWIAQFGADALINRRSNTWRGMSGAVRASAGTPEGAVALIRANPALMKRPVIVVNGDVHIGWGPDVREELGV